MKTRFIYKTVNMKNCTITRHSLETPGCLELPKAYTSKFSLADNKKKDIQELVDKKKISTYYYNSFFKDVLALC